MSGSRVAAGVLLVAGSALLFVAIAGDAVDPLLRRSAWLISALGWFGFAATKWAAAKP